MLVSKLALLMQPQVETKVSVETKGNTMRIREFAQDSNDSELKSAIIGVLEFVRNRAHDKRLMPSIGTIGLINMVNNQLPGSGLNYATLKQICDSDQTLQGLVTEVNRDTVELAPFGDEPDAPKEPEDSTAGGGSAKDPTAIVDKMAKKASAKRDSLA
jgi:hypothetical protein